MPAGSHFPERTFSVASSQKSQISSEPKTVAQKLAHDGYAVVPDVLDGELLRSLRTMVEEELSAQGCGHFDTFRHHGSMLPIDRARAEVVTLVGWPPLLDVLNDAGFSAPKWLSGYVISKPPHSPGLWWHQDWWAWDEAVSFGPTPPQMFVMYYLTDTKPENGCLRVIPGSHRARHGLHGHLPEAHSQSEGLRDLDGPAHLPHPDEVAVQVKAGDAVLGDVRVLHATYPNQSDQRRTCLTLWYMPAFEELPAALKAYVVQHPALPPAGWWNDASIQVDPSLSGLLPVYDGDVSPASYNRVPPVSWSFERTAATLR
ncbi:MAG: hypothetical protein QOE65_937 [Solirubrobacteraceae bacterium]|jgi:hypothetical protein|nr:hypothetical protein [Solirubrobacteraceae bacterium]